MSKKVYIKNFGCQMNVRDSEVIVGLLRAMNYELTTKPDEADIIIFNTCSVRQHAEDRVWSGVGQLKKKGRPQSTVHSPQIIGIVGCMAQNYKQAIFEKAPSVDFVVGPSDIHKIPEIIEKVTGHRSQVSGKGLFEQKIWETDGSLRPEEIYHTGFYEDKEHAYVVISEGCSNYCSYCVVPYVRGELHNRNYEDIVREIKEATDKGITRVTLLGQNVNAYQFPVSSSQSPVSFPQLLRLVNNISGLKEFSFITSHPKDTTADLFQAMAGLEKLKKCLHLPVQSGSDRILELMNRGYTRNFYLDLADKYRKIVKNGVLTTDIIVGFSGESEEDFQDTRSLVEEMEFDAGYIFKYSPRPHTRAAGFADDVPQQEKEKRHALILELQRKISKRK
jgi:tRNA-2-methylthio-N6-dimethylallyladenosine synthase